jgi:hypothetical protein
MPIIAMRIGVSGLNIFTKNTKKVQLRQISFFASVKKPQKEQYRDIQAE